MSNPADPNRSTRMYRAVTPLSEEDIHPGAIIGDGRFKIFGIIGRGKMASVFRARDLRRNTDIALKVLARTLVGQHEPERRFDNEVRLAGRLQGHRNVVAPIESGRLDDCGGRMFLAMELVRGPTLADLVSMHGPLPVEEACMYMRDIARALRDLHQSGVVHRDVKPENVIVVEHKGERVAKLLDFGLAADTGAGADARMTRMGERPGTRHYMSPEQAWDAPAHPVFDVYALGVTFYEILTGHPPFFELDEAEVIARKCDVSQPAPSIKGRRNDMPEKLEVLVDSCLEPIAKKRLPTINAFLKRLDAATSESFGGQDGAMSARTRQQTSMVGQARTIAQPKQRKSKLPELMAQAAARKQQPHAPEPSASPEAPTPDPDRIVTRRAVNRAVEGLAQSATALGGQPATVPHLQPTEPHRQAYPPGPAAAGHGAPPSAARGHTAPAPTARPMHGHTAPAPTPTPRGHAGSPASPMGTPTPAPRKRPPKRRTNAGQRAILVGLIFGAVLSALLVVGLWMWISIRRGG
ncbi:serine/threonine-protein kinase [Paraliomyxa miuraensis]|uniref:serine/threonine-protein kinase n=1 Tax=Paraliomyxa miuraensis TaxID=376150 RepID=UPI00224F05B8|nr:serine/threonine protein kinase [Paraliomyxa miuraensis]MCX4240354.1 protein kinase [Paraliomyxa miuraensis]